MKESSIQIALTLTPENVEAQCIEAIKQSRNASHALAALIALQSFIAATVHATHKFTPAYETVKAVVERHASEIRAQILAESADALAGAIRRQDRQEIARIHASLSRNGFWQMAQQAARQLGDSELLSAATWSRNWCRDAKASAEAASGFPDALDFHKAGISAAEYAAMTEISRYVTEALP